MEYRNLTWTLLLLTVAHYQGSESSANAITKNIRSIRAVRKPGFFRTLFSVAYEQWADGRDTANYVRNLLNENIVDDSRTPLPTTTTPSNNNSNGSTTAAPFVLTRSDVTRIINRNVNGLVRLYNLELDDALKV
ncbi:hypothetical protein MML48_4g00016277 [Holotrichia oblita]|uniref:Uncharacterized protein n=1 Tax=Holotrichia oblita TaxID=644536 RepID=A0ACB9T8S6_HOLOL|nr:hypothetical protein MML48_4g00016277 [Holotrichia oblita]